MDLRYNTSSETLELVSEDLSDELKRLLLRFPKTVYSVAYGSAIFAQKNQEKGKMIDLIFVVNNPAEWHAENLERNAGHYSFLKYLGPNAIASLQEKFACGVYYNTFANIDNKVLKYGVIGTDSVADDLMNWTHAYIPGRLHKPVKELYPCANPELLKCIRINHEYALRASLLQLPHTFTKFELYYAISELSYIGDSRMIMGENPNKVYNIVASNSPAFDEIYVPVIRSKLSDLVCLAPDGLVTQDKTTASICQHLCHLPTNLQHHIAQKYKGGVLVKNVFWWTEDDLHLIMTELAFDPSADIPKILRDAIGQLIWISSLRQTITGFLSTGVFGSLKYALEKFKKAFFS